MEIINTNIGWLIFIAITASIFIYKKAQKAPMLIRVNLKQLKKLKVYLTII